MVVVLSFFFDEQAFVNDERDVLSVEKLSGLTKKK